MIKAWLFINVSTEAPPENEPLPDGALTWEADLMEPLQDDDFLVTEIFT